MERTKAKQPPTITHNILREVILILELKLVHDHPLKQQSLHKTRMKKTAAHPNQYYKNVQNGRSVYDK